MNWRTFPRPAMAAALFTSAGLALAVSLVGSRPADAQISGFDVYRSNCDGCHELYDPDSPRRTRQQWETIMTRMVKVRGATLSTIEFKAVLEYLDSFNRPKREIKWNDSPAASHKSNLTAAESGKLPLNWVDLTVGSDEQVPWAVQSDGAGKSVYLSPLKTVGENQFPILLDNSGLVRDGSVATRLQLVSGRGAVGAGLIFGFRNPQSFFGVRVGPRDLVLYEVQSGQRARLASAPMAIPLKQWQAIEVSVANKAVTVSVNGQVVSALARNLPAYQGGRVGINTQGDTVALFDQWAVAVSK